MYYRVAASITIQTGLLLQIISVAWLSPLWFNTLSMPYTLEFSIIVSQDLNAKLQTLNKIQKILIRILRIVGIC